MPGPTHGTVKAALRFSFGAFIVFGALVLVFDLATLKGNVPHPSAVLFGGVIAALLVSLAAALSFASINRRLHPVPSSTLFLLGGASALVTCVASFFGHMMHPSPAPVAVQVVVTVSLICIPSIVLPLVALRRIA
jgi:hypothetical protein